MYLFKFLLLVKLSTAFGLRAIPSYDSYSLLMKSSSMESKCSIIKNACKDILEQLECLPDETPNQPPENPDKDEIPRPPEYNPSQKPPQPNESDKPGNHPPPKPSDPGNSGKPTPTNKNIQSGSYIASWYAYKKHYMGINKINVFNQPVSAFQASSEYVFFPYHMRNYASKLTHVYYAFWKIGQDCVVELDDPDAAWYGAVNNVEPSWIPIPSGACKGIMNDMMALKSEFPHLKMLMSLGGWTFSRYFSKCTATRSDRDKIIRSIFFRLNEMDPNFGKPNAIWNGVDLDWEFPEASNGLYPDHLPNDWDNFVTLTNEFKRAAANEGRNDFYVSSAIGMGTTLTRLYQKPETTKRFCAAMDMVNLMEYDLHGKWDRTTGHNANFCKDTRKGDKSLGLSVITTVTNLINAGCPANKMSLGIPNYSPAWTRIAPGEYRNGIFTQASSDQFVGWSTFSDKDDAFVPQGIISYWDMKANVLSNPDFEVYSQDCPADEGVVVPLKHVYSAKHQAFATLEDPEVVRAKIKWAKAKGLGGFFFWDSQQDKYGELVKEAFSTWGLQEHPAAGSYMCHNNAKPDFDKDPLSGMKVEAVCRLTDNKVSINSGESCSVGKQKAQLVCGNNKTPVVTGGCRSYNPTACLNMCSPKWGATGNMVYVGDIVYFQCV